MAIESLLDIDTLSVEELIGRLKTAEEQYDLSGSGSGASAGLNMTEDELVARVASRLQLSGGGGLGGNCTSSSQGHGHDGGHGRDAGGSGGSRPLKSAGRSGKGKCIVGDECKYCGKTGQWARKCCKKKRDEQAHVAQVEEEPMEGALMLGFASIVAHTEVT